MLLLTKCSSAVIHMTAHTVHTPYSLPLSSVCMCVCACARTIGCGCRLPLRVATETLLEQSIDHTHAGIQIYVCVRAPLGQSTGGLNNS